MILHKPMDQLEREDVTRQVLEAAAKRIEDYAANSLYRKALKIGAKLIREMKPG